MPLTLSSPRNIPVVVIQIMYHICLKLYIFADEEHKIQSTK